MIVMDYRGACLATILGASVLLAALATAAAQEPQEMVAPGAIQPLRRLPTGPAVPSTSTLQQDLTRLHAELAELTSQGESTNPNASDGEAERVAQIARLRTRVQELILRIRLRRSARKPPAPTPVSNSATPPTSTPMHPPQTTPSPNPGPSKPRSPIFIVPPPPSSPPPVAIKPAKQFDLPAARIGKAVDPWALAQALFESHDNDNALKAYRVLTACELAPGDRVTVQYMIACCLRNLGKRDEAATLFREVANSRDNDMLADCARWQLHALRWRQDLEAQLAGFRQRRQALESKP